MEDVSGSTGIESAIGRVPAQLLSWRDDRAPHPPPMIVSDQLATACINAAIFIVAKLEKVSDIA